MRVSTCEQLEYSPSAQKNAIMQYAKKNNIHIPECNIFIDEGISGRKAEKRPAFMSMIKKAKEKPKPFDVILVHKFDRFARSREDSVVYKSLLKKDCNIKVISITEQLEEDKFSIILESMLEAMAEYYSLNLSDEVKKGMKEKARRGEMQTRPPLGYKFVNGKVVVDDDEKEIVQLIYNKFVNDNMGYVNIANTLNNMGYHTKNNGLFQSKSIKYILENPFYVGIVRWNRKNRNGVLKDEEKWIVSNGDHEKIIDDYIYHQAIKKIERMKKTKKINHSNEYSHYLSGLIRCAYCKGSMVYKNNQKRYSYFRCRKSSEGACLQRKMIRVSLIEKMMEDKLVEDFNNVLVITKHKKIYMNNQRKFILGKLNKLDNKYNKIKKAYIEDIDSIEEYKVNKSKLSEERKNLIKELENISSISFDEENSILLHNVFTTNEYPIPIRNKIYSSFIDKIEVDVIKKTIQINYYRND
ncbi:recombinase family protein [Vallitalea guaymasensis]|nr:recombinase family protein [Vallitalea guaymasensis]